MFYGIAAGATWAVETIILGIALSMAPIVSTEQAIFLAPRQAVQMAAHSGDKCPALRQRLRFGSIQQLRLRGGLPKTRLGLA